MFDMVFGRGTGFFWGQDLQDGQDFFGGDRICRICRMDRIFLKGDRICRICRMDRIFLKGDRIYRMDRILSASPTASASWAYGLRTLSGDKLTEKLSHFIEHSLPSGSVAVGEADKILSIL